MGHVPQPERLPWEEEFAAYYTARGGILRRTAFVLCGDWHLAEDLTQTTFINLYRVWHRIERHDVLDQYARRVLLRVFLDHRRRPWHRDVVAEPGNPDLDVEVYDDRGREDGLVLRTALLRLPKRRRAVLVLRFWVDLSVEQVADVLQCPIGTVKSQTARGLAELRGILGGALGDLGPPPRREVVPLAAESRVRGIAVSADGLAMHPGGRS